MYSNFWVLFIVTFYDKQNRTFRRLLNENTNDPFAIKPQSKKK